MTLEKSDNLKHVLAVPDFASGSIARKDNLFINAVASFCATLGAELSMLAPRSILEDLGKTASLLIGCDLPPGVFQADALHNVIEALVEQYGFHSVVFPSSEWGEDLVRRLSVSGNKAFASCVGFVTDHGFVQHIGQEHELLVAPCELLTLSEQFVGADARVAPTQAIGFASVSTCSVEFIEMGCEQLGDVTTAPLDSARFIIAAGNGVTDWSSFGELAKALGATVGASRVVCDRGFLPRDRQVGSSGTLVSSRVYIALGISGAVQHLDGIQDVEFVISVNSDPGAPIHARAVLPIVADANAVVQHLLEASVTKEHGHG